MKNITAIFVCLVIAVSLVVVQAASVPGPTPVPVPVGLLGDLPDKMDVDVEPLEYHLPIGMPEAARILAAEEEMARAESEAGAGPAAMIVGGLGSFRGEHPFMAGLVVTLLSGQTSVCGGSLVSSTRVLTAATCYYDGVNQAYSIEVVLGSVKLFSGGTRVYATSIVLHPVFTPWVVTNNLAVLTIPYQSPTSYIKPIQMARGSEQFVGYRAEVIGFGRTSDSAAITSSASLRDIFLNVVSNSECSMSYPSGVTVSEMCTSGAGGVGPCGGDAGGPLILYSSSGNDLLIGVFTWLSTRGCSAGDPAGYMRASPTSITGSTANCNYIHTLTDYHIHNRHENPRTSSQRKEYLPVVKIYINMLITTTWQLIKNLVKQ